MEIHADLHAHSAYAGGARAGANNSSNLQKKIRKRFTDSAIYSPLKGVNLIGTGDAQFEPWTEFLQSHFEEIENGVYSYTGELYGDIPQDESYKQPTYILQTELIFTGPIPDFNRKKRVHVVFLFPDFESLDELNTLMDKWGVARKNMARPFIVCETTEEVNERLQAILDIHPLVEGIPAHILTPEGVYGGNNRVNFMKDFFGEVHERLNAIETGLSADPTILGLIPELDRFTIISNADAHSAGLNRVGREFTSYKLNKMNYPSLIDAIRKNQVMKTAEFHPTEGRYFLTGHRDLRKKPGMHEKHQYCYFSPKYVPKGDLCPQCNKELTIGVLQRAFEISNAQEGNRQVGDGPKREFVTMVPLIEIIAHSLGIKTITSKKVKNIYQQVIDITKTEVNLWIDDRIQQELVGSSLPSNLVDEILMVKEGNFCFYPGGYDGTYGILKIGETLDYQDINVVNK